MCKRSRDQPKGGQSRVFQAVVRFRPVHRTLDNSRSDPKIRARSWEFAWQRWMIRDESQFVSLPYNSPVQVAPMAFILSRFLSWADPLFGSCSGLVLSKEMAPVL